MKRAAHSSGLTGPRHYWAVMCRLSAENGLFDSPTVYSLTNGVGLRTVKDYVRHSAAVGAIVKVGERPTIKNRTAILYRVVNPLIEAPVMRRASFANDRGRRQQQLWTTIRALRHFTSAELALAASTDVMPVSQKVAQFYLCELARAGIVAEIEPRTARGQVARWKLMPAGNTGPRAPAITAKGLVDRNLIPVINLNRVSGTEPRDAKASNRRRAA